ncbi:MAG: radical SAM protein [Gluconacetobacter diazotrophicus]|nr:radical SAM protein [Gluconacetobacter diazotrophicus]
MNAWSILYRGPLSSCNYGCDYCPFAKTTNTRAELRDDAEKLARFVGWVEGRAESIGVLFTPWGEALFHRAYQRAIVRLSGLPNVRRVSIQTNLSARLGWLADCVPGKVALWTTFHPSQTPRERFVAQCNELDRLGVAHSVGVVGMKDAVADIEALRGELNPATYLWVNAYKREADYYSAEDLARLERVDPLFPLNNRRHPSLGETCRAGASVFSVDGEGTMRRCHFIRAPIGNIYAPGFESALRERPCTNAVCGCHIGYVHLDRLDLYRTFGDGVLERIPVGAPVSAGSPASNVPPPPP